MGVEVSWSERELARLGLRELRPIVGGWQSVGVYRAQVDGRAVAVKVVDPGDVDRAVFEARIEAVGELAGKCELVCGPVKVRGRLINEIGAGYVVAYEFAEGQGPDVGARGDAEEMGRVLAELHGVMATVPDAGLPGLAAFPGAADLAPRQLLHGDFSAKNVRGWRVFDFDDCGYGAVELDVANSLYFVLFDAMTGGDPGRYERFRAPFLAGYGADRPADEVLDALVTGRVRTLAAWLDDPATAPPGVRTADDAWRAVLAGFVRGYLGT